MDDPHDQVRQTSIDGIGLPPICLGTSAFGNVRRVIPEQSKLEICGAWFRGDLRPVWIDVDYRHGDGAALEVVGRMLRRLDATSDEIAIALKLGASSVLRGTDDRAEDCADASWNRSSRLLGDEYRPKFVYAAADDEASLRTARRLKAEGMVRSVGILVSDAESAGEQIAAFQPDWVTLAGGFTVMHQRPATVALIRDLAARRIPIILASVFDCGFLLGGHSLHGRVITPEDLKERALLAWRKSFVALCDAHGIRPAHACIQFALSTPGVTAVCAESSYADRTAENIRSAQQAVPAHFWASMKEEGLLPDDHAL